MENLTYTDFSEKCINDLQSLQDKFQSKYDLNWYQKWFYDQATGLLTFSTGEKELNFKYLEVGTYSTKTNTWKWSWDNDHTLKKVKEQTNLVREYGQKFGYQRLTEGYVESSEEEAWEFTAVTAKIINGIGAYRPVSEHILIFMVLLEVVDNETAKNIKDKYVSCGAHESGRRAFVCRHLNKKTKVGFEEAFETHEDMELLDDDDFQAWCVECENVRQQEGEWNDTSMKFANIKIVCEVCYFEMKELNLGHR